MHYNKILVTLCVCFYINFVSSSPIDSSQLCKDPCNPTVKGKINIHLVPHSHDDVGWLSTFEQYYYGTGDYSMYEHAGVQHILNSTVEALKANPLRKYIQVETAFFWKWWQNQNDTGRQDVIKLINNGQLEIINGAWSMNDEAAAHYHSIIDQFTWGFKIIDDTLGQCARPKTGWQIDPFGHSREHASLLTQFGFDGLVVGRIDYRDKDQRRADKNLDFIWQTSNDLDHSELFTTMFPEFYGSERGFCFDVLCSDYVDDHNLKEKVNKLSERLDTFKEWYQTSNILLPMGGDFTYQVAEKNFKNMDKLLKGFENHERYNVFYSTPSCYIRAVKSEIEKNSLTLKLKTDDFFPYGSVLHSFWTGYFTSRPTSKRFERVGNNILQGAKQLTTFSRINGKEYDASINNLRAAMGVMQHHDAITGTAKQAVANDYARLLHEGIKEAEAPVGVIIEDLLKKDSEAEIDLKLHTCLLSNISICATTQKERFVVVVQNPLSRIVTHYVRLPVEGTSYKITGPNGEEIYDVFDTIHDFGYVKEEVKPSSKELVFAARDLPPLGIKLYYVEKTEGSGEYKPFKEITEDDTYFGTENNGFTVNPNTGKLETVTIKGRKEEITQDILYYSGFGYSTNKASGAYIFRPTDSNPVPIAAETVTFKAAKGNLVDEFIQILSNEATQITRVYKGEKDAYIEFDWLVGDLQYVDNNKGKEVITKFTIKDFSNEGIFYTDSNGRQQMKRELNKRSDYSYDPSAEPVSSNYYPVTSKMVIKDEKKNLELAILNDRAQGGTSLKNGEVELMIHRRLIADDGYGVSERLDEQQYGRGLYARGQHFLTFGSTNTQMENDKSTSAFERDIAQRKLLAPWILVADATTSEFDSLEKVNKMVNFKFEALKRSLPDNVQILTLEPWTDSYILRLEHVLQKGEDDVLSQQVTIDLKDLFTLFNITDIQEVKLGANQLIDDDGLEDSLEVTLNPMQIKTFLIKTNKNNKGGHYIDEDTDNNDDENNNNNDNNDNKDNGDDDNNNKDNNDDNGGNSSQPVYVTSTLILLFLIILNAL